MQGYRKLYVGYPMAAIAMILSDIEGHCCRLKSF